MQGCLPLNTTTAPHKLNGHNFGVDRTSHRLPSTIIERFTELHTVRPQITLRTTTAVKESERALTAFCAVPHRPSLSPPQIHFDLSDDADMGLITGDGLFVLLRTHTQTDKTDIHRACGGPVCDHPVGGMWVSLQRYSMIAPSRLLVLLSSCPEAPRV